jgi:hypothetical protein
VSLSECHYCECRSATLKQPKMISAENLMTLEQQDSIHSESQNLLDKQFETRRNKLECFNTRLHLRPSLIFESKTQNLAN